MTIPLPGNVPLQRDAAIPDARSWKMTPALWGVLGVAVALLVALSYDSLAYMVHLWSSKEEYGYAYALPFVAAFMVWQRRPRLDAIAFRGAWSGVAVVVVGLVLALIGELGTLHAVVQYAFLIILAGIALTLMGWSAFRQIVPALVLLGFIVPLPNFLYQTVSEQSQLASSQLGVAMLRALGISVFLEGNVIDLGTYRLQVAEACNGLRYLFPLMALGYIAAWFFHGSMWKRLIIFASTIPITIVMNSGRIAAIGVMVDRWGVSMAEGFLHDFEGWVVFMICIAVLVLEMALLARIGRQRQSLREAFGVELPQRRERGERATPRSLPAQLVCAVGLLVIAAAVVAAMPDRVEEQLARKDLAAFPMTLGEWAGRPDRLERVYLDVLKLSDYILADYAGPAGSPINLYVAYYASQRKGESAHSPRSCIPGGGWEITSLAERRIPRESGAEPLRVNRAVIQKGADQQLVYYWFQQRGRLVTNEFLVKWFLFWDALVRNRTDGALVRLMVDVSHGQTLADADARLTAFARIVQSQLPEYVPD